MGGKRLCFCLGSCSWICSLQAYGRDAHTGAGDSQVILTGLFPHVFSVSVSQLAEQLLAGHWVRYLPASWGDSIILDPFTPKGLSGTGDSGAVHARKGTLWVSRPACHLPPPHGMRKREGPR